MNAKQKALLNVIQTFRGPDITDLEAALNVIMSHADTINKLSAENLKLREIIFSANKQMENL